MKSLNLELNCGAQAPEVGHLPIKLGLEQLLLRALAHQNNFWAFARESRKWYLSRYLENWFQL